MNKARNSLKKTKECHFCKKDRVIWKNLDGNPACQSCAAARTAKEKKGKSTKTKPAKKKLKPITKLKQELDIAFSIYIRLRDSDSQGFCSCATCGERIYYKNIQNGHFMSRTHMSTRFHEQNCSAQCVACNVYKSGLQYQHGLHLDKKWGEGTSLQMLEMSQKIVKISRDEYEEKIVFYRSEIERLKSEKGIV